MGMIHQVKQIMNMVKSAQDPQAMLNQFASNNPLLKQALDTTQQYGGDSMKALRETAKQMGFDPNEILNMLK